MDDSLHVDISKPNCLQGRTIFSKFPMVVKNGEDVYSRVSKFNGTFHADTFSGLKFVGFLANNPFLKPTNENFDECVLEYRKKALHGF